MKFLFHPGISFVNNFGMLDVSSMLDTSSGHHGGHHGPPSLHTRLGTVARTVLRRPNTTLLPPTATIRVHKDGFWSKLRCKAQPHHLPALQSVNCNNSLNTSPGVCVIHLCNWWNRITYKTLRSDAALIWRWRRWTRTAKLNYRMREARNWS